MKLIDADALIEVIKKNHYPLRDAFNSLDVGMFTNGIIQAINELAENGYRRCKDCAKRGQSVFQSNGTEYIVCWNHGYGIQHPADWFCADSEKNGKIGGEVTMKRTPQNCTIADRVYDRDDPNRYEGDKCSGVRGSVGFNDDGDEPIEICRNCKLCASYEE